MARENNFLLGYGERLTKQVNVPTGGGPKNPPYSIDKARERLQQKIEVAADTFANVPGDAAPEGEVVAIVTMHPRYIAKSDFPQELLSAMNVRAIGSRSRQITPEAWGIKKHRETAITEDIFVAGKREAFRRLSQQLPSWSMEARVTEQLTHVEDLHAFEAATKLRNIPVNSDVEAILEIVLHNGRRLELIESFVRYARAHDAEPIVSRQRNVKGLTFLPVRTSYSRALDLARFSFVRVARPLPALRPVPMGIARLSPSALTLPTDGPADGSFRALIFDGGLPISAVPQLSPWVHYIEPAGIGSPVAALQEHGLAVTTAFLFGPILPSGKLPRPICGVDHVRVIDDRTVPGADYQYVDVLDRIIEHLDRNPGRHQFINLSIGPNMPVDDDEVTLWTASLDERLAHGAALVTVAAGNDGDYDASSGLNRIQPPADGVNVLAVGASDRLGTDWLRATYSSVGPGRTPGFVKPDGVAFGGSATEPFGVLGTGSGLEVTHTQGTSLSSPYGLRTGVSVRAQLGAQLSPLAIRALLIHRAEPLQHSRTEVGWGRFEDNPETLITCADDESLVVYQGLLPVGEHLRALIPLPDSKLAGDVVISATLVIAPEVEPEHPGTYTRSGIQVAFRPNASRYNEYQNGKRSAHPKTQSFFSASNLYGASEQLLREEGYKWEPCLRSSQKFRASKLDRPSFDIYYHHRQGGTKASNAAPIPYALIVSVRAPAVGDLYNRTVRTYANILLPLRPQLRIPVRTAV